MTTAISFPFRIAPDGRIALTRTYNEVVRGQVIDALMTNFGERVMRPRYGCDIQAALFDPTDELMRKDAAGLIKGKLEQLVPRAIIRSVTLTEAAETTIYITVVYRPTLYATDTQVSVPISSEFVNRQLQSISGGVNA